MIIILVLALFSSGCASYGLNLIYIELFVNRKLTEEDIKSDETYVLDVPFKEQESSNCCGITCLKMVLEYWAKPSELPITLRKTDCLPAGITGKKLKELAIAKGFEAFVYEGDLADIHKNLSATRPVIVILSFFGSNHFVVVSGYSKNGNLIINDPSKGRMFVDIKDFLDRWEKAKYFSLLIVPKKT